MQCYNAFNQIHKALRALLYDAALNLQQTDFRNSTECDAVVEKVTAILDLFETHAHAEDNHIFSAIEMFEPAIVDAFEQEHVTDLQLCKSIQHNIAALYRTRSENEKSGLGKKLTSAFIQFMIFNLNHMAKEEEVLNEILWRYYSDAEIKKIEAVIKQNIPPEKQPLIAKWMLRGISNCEAIEWLQGIAQHAPFAVFQTILALAEAELPASRFERIASNFTKQTALA